MNILFDYQIKENGSYGMKWYYDHLTKALRLLEGENNISEVGAESNKVNAITRMSNDIAFRKALSGDVDILHITGDNPRYLKKLKDMKNVRKVVTISSNLLKDGFTGSDVIHRGELVRECDGIIFTSEAVRDDFKSTYPGVDVPSVVIHAGYSDVAVKECDVPIPYILYVGSRERHDNFALLMDAFALIHKQFPLFELICAGGPKFSDSETSRFKVMGYGDKITYVDPSEEELIWLYQNATCLICPALSNDLGEQIIEGKHNGCAMVLSDTRSHQELAGDKAVFFDAAYDGDLAERIQDMILDWEEHIEEPEGIRSWQDVARETMEFYERLKKGNLIAFPS